MSDQTPTPETDDAQFGTGRVSVDFARRLERERDEATTKCGQIGSKLVVAERERDEAQAEVARLREAGDKLIDAIHSVQDWTETYVGECIDEFEALAAVREAEKGA
jgi:hypothetical protein